MKIKILLICALVAGSATARVINRFHGWDELKNDSSYIAVVHCGNPIPPKLGVFVEGATKSDSEIQTLLTLKGTNNASPIRILTDYELCPGKNYLVFGYCNDNVYRAFEDYRVIPLDRFFSTNSIAGKNLDEQLQILLKIGLSDVARQLNQKQEEMQRLEEGLKK